jgi:hypothetical protein
MTIFDSDSKSLPDKYKVISKRPLYMDPKSFLQLNITFINDISIIFRDLGKTNKKLIEIISNIEKLSKMKEEFSKNISTEINELNS